MNIGNYRAAMSNLSMLLQVRERVEGEVKASARNDDEHRTKPTGGVAARAELSKDGRGQGWSNGGCTAAELGSVEWPLDRQG
jgi:hypothetical protein